MTDVAAWRMARSRAAAIRGRRRAANRVVVAPSRPAPSHVTVRPAATSPALVAARSPGLTAARSPITHPPCTALEGHFPHGPDGACFYGCEDHP